MSILGDFPIGIIKGDSFYGIEQSQGHCSHFYCCDSFNVDPEIVNDRLIFNVVFYSPIGEQKFDWDLVSLNYLSRPRVLSETLRKHDVRCCSSARAAIAVINAIQNTYTKETANVH